MLKLLIWLYCYYSSIKLLYWDPPKIKGHFFFPQTPIFPGPNIIMTNPFFWTVIVLYFTCCVHFSSFLTLWLFFSLLLKITLLQGSKLFNLYILYSFHKFSQFFLKSQLSAICRKLIYTSCSDTSSQLQTSLANYLLCVCACGWYGKLNSIISQVKLHCSI